MRESIMDLDLSERIRQIQQEEGRINTGPIHIAGPAGNPTQPDGRSDVTVSGPDAFCSKCGAKHGLKHFTGCGAIVPPADYDYYCGFNLRPNGKPRWIEKLVE